MDRSQNIVSWTGYERDSTQVNVFAYAFDTFSQTQIK